MADQNLINEKIEGKLIFKKYEINYKSKFQVQQSWMKIIMIKTIILMIALQIQILFINLYHKTSKNK